MRLWYAGATAVAVIMGMQLLLLSLPKERVPEIVFHACIVVTYAVTVLVCYAVFNEPTRKSSRWETWEKQGVATSQSFRAIRAFRVEQPHKGVHCFVELENGQVLFLSGPYSCRDEIATSQPKTLAFEPALSTEFEIKRHRTRKGLAEIVLRGAPLPFEANAPWFSPEDYHLGRVPEDGEIMENATYDEIKRERIALTSAHPAI